MPNSPHAGAVIYAAHPSSLSAFDARVWRFLGCMVCDGYDPEGNIFQARQRVD